MPTQDLAQTEPSAEADHTIAGSTIVGGGVRLHCACGWASQVFPSGVGIAAAWDAHWSREPVAVDEELQLIRHELDRLVHARFQDAWRAADEQRYRRLTRREAELIAARS